MIIEDKITIEIDIEKAREVQVMREVGVYLEKDNLGLIVTVVTEIAEIVGLD